MRFEVRVECEKARSVDGRTKAPELRAAAPTGASVHMNARAEGEKSLIVKQVE